MHAHSILKALTTVLLIKVSTKSCLSSLSDMLTCDIVFINSHRSMFLFLGYGISVLLYRKLAQLMVRAGEVDPTTSQALLYIPAP